MYIFEKELKLRENIEEFFMFQGSKQCDGKIFNIPTRQVIGGCGGTKVKTDKYLRLPVCPGQTQGEGEAAPKALLVGLGSRTGGKKAVSFSVSGRTRESSGGARRAASSSPHRAWSRSV